MPKVHHVKKARKDYPEAGIDKGSEYYWWKFNFGPKVKSKTYPRQSQLTRSEFLGWYYDLQDEINGLNDPDSAQEDLDNIISQIEDQEAELQDRYDNMPDSLQENSDSGQLLQERIDGLDGWKSDLENIDIETYTEMDNWNLDEDASEEDIEAERERQTEELFDAIRDTDPGLS